MVVDGASGVYSEVAGVLIVFEDVLYGGFELVGVLDLYSGMVVEEGAGDFGKVLHVGAEDYRFGERGRLDRVMAAATSKAFPDEND